MEEALLWTPLSGPPPHLTPACAHSLGSWLEPGCGCARLGHQALRCTVWPDSASKNAGHSVRLGFQIVHEHILVLGHPAALGYRWASTALPAPSTQAREKPPHGWNWNLVRNSHDQLEKGVMFTKNHRGLRRFSLQALGQLFFWRTGPPGAGARFQWEGRPLEPAPWRHRGSAWDP